MSSNDYNISQIIETESYVHGNKSAQLEQNYFIEKITSKYGFWDGGIILVASFRV